jgi:hypothetical protein
MDDDALPDDDPTIVQFRIAEGDWMYAQDSYGDWRGTSGDRRTRLKSTLVWAKQDAASGRLQRRGPDGWIDTMR